MARALAASAAILAASAATAADERLRSDLATVAARSVYFGHQSVGTDILEGVRLLAAREGVALRVVEAPSARGLGRGTIGHSLLAENGDPGRKLEGFRRALDDGAGPDADVALLKFCFVDFTADSDVAPVFERYLATVRRLQAAHPATTFVHVTVPLTGIQAGARGFVKRLLGRAPYGLAENARREAYNALLRAAVAGKEPLFDLARVESTRPDGGVETAAWKGGRVPALVPGYTTDGGHLNDAGRRVAARELLAVIAAAPLHRPGEPAAGR